MSIFNNFKESFPYTDYHTFNLDFIVTKLNELVEYVRTKTGIPKETADIYYVPKCDGEDEETGNIKVDIGMEKDNNDNCNYMLRPYGDAAQLERGFVGLDGSESSSKSPTVVLKSSILTGIKMWFDSLTHILNIQGAGTDYEGVSLKGTGNHDVKVTGVAAPTTTDGAVNKGYLDSNYTDTEGLILTVNNAMNDVPMYRTMEITDSSAMSRGEIQTMIDNSVPSTDDFISAVYDVGNPQFLHPDESDIFAARWRIGNNVEPSVNDAYIGFTTYNSDSYGGSVISCLPDQSGFGWMIHREGVDDFIEMRFTPDTNGVYHYPTELRLGVNNVAVKLVNVALPTSDFDGANKRYVDEAIQTLEARISALEH